MRLAWQAKQDGKLPKKEARDFGLLFDADRVFDLYWKPVSRRAGEAHRVRRLGRVRVMPLARTYDPATGTVVYHPLPGVPGPAVPVE